jgi:hypothetical protein
LDLSFTTLFFSFSFAPDLLFLLSFFLSSADYLGGSLGLNNSDDLLVHLARQLYRLLVSDVSYCLFVTDDKELTKRLQSSGLAVMKAREFLCYLQVDDDDNDDDDEEEEDSSPSSSSSSSDERDPRF